MQPEVVTAPSTLSDLLAGESMCARLARYLIAHRGEWVDGRELSKVGGYAAYRTRLSDLRKAPWFMDIANRYRHVKEDGRKFVISEYKLVA